MIIKRRDFLGGLVGMLSFVISAPVIVRPRSIMPDKLPSAEHDDLLRRFADKV